MRDRATQTGAGAVAAFGIRHDRTRFAPRFVQGRDASSCSGSSTGNDRAPTIHSARASRGETSARASAGTTATSVTARSTRSVARRAGAISS